MRQISKQHLFDFIVVFCNLVVEDKKRYSYNENIKLPVLLLEGHDILKDCLSYDHINVLLLLLLIRIL